jgi:ectoine hydroxylase-related dioxygenase (phytanoyl-CoA dioxygenase family)
MGATATLSNEQREQFDRDGYFVVEDTGMPIEKLDAIVSNLEDKYIDEGDRFEDEVYYTSGRIMDAWHIDENVRALALSPPMLALLEHLYGRKPLPFQTLNFYRGTQQPPHSDTIHFNSMPEGFMCGVWVALEDMDMDNGPLIYYPGSHKLPELRMQDAGVPGSSDHYPDYEKMIAEQIERHGLRPEYGTIKKGQALIWSANLLHGGSLQRDMSRTRHSQVTHYFFEGCRYWTPMLSDDNQTTWREPNWVE